MISEIGSREVQDNRYLEAVISRKCAASRLIKKKINSEFLNKGHIRTLEILEIVLNTFHYHYT